MAFIMNEQIQERIDQILSEYAQLTEMGECEPPELEVMNEKGDIKVTIFGYTHDGRKKIAERLIKSTDSLEWISDTFAYPDYIGRQSKDIAPEAVRDAYFDQLGNLMVDHNDGSVEKFKIKERHREEITTKLKDKLGKKLKV